MQKNTIILFFLPIFIVACASLKIPPQSHPTTKKGASLINSDFSNVINPDGIWSMTEKTVAQFLLLIT